MFLNGLELLDRAGAATRATTGCAGLDAALRGGLRAGTVTELYGESGSGKTQLCLQATAANWRKGVVYISTEDAFPSRRLQQMLESLPDHEPGTVCGERIYIEHLTEVEELQRCVRARLPTLLSKCKARMLVVDSVAAPFRVGYSNYATRAQDMREIGWCLLQAAKRHDLAVLCVNQVATSFTGDTESELIPTLGLSWSNMVSTRLLVSKTNQWTNTSEIAYNLGLIRGHISDNVGLTRDNMGLNRENIDKISDRTDIDRDNKGEISDKLDQVRDNVGLKRDNAGQIRHTDEVCDSMGQIRDKMGLKRDNTGEIRGSTDQVRGGSVRRMENMVVKSLKMGQEWDQITDKVVQRSDISTQKYQIRCLHVVFAPDLPNIEVPFIVNSSGVFSEN